MTLQAEKKKECHSFLMRDPCCLWRVNYPSIAFLVKNSFRPKCLLTKKKEEKGNRILNHTADWEDRGMGEWRNSGLCVKWQWERWNNERPDFLAEEKLSSFTVTWEQIEQFVFFSRAPKVREDFKVTRQPFSWRMSTQAKCAVSVMWCQ